MLRAYMDPFLQHIIVHICPFFTTYLPKPNYKCNKCSKIGHLANICHSKLKSNNFLEVEEDLYCINLNVNQICNPFIVKVNIDDTVLEMEIDSGAAISCISRETYYNQFSSYPLSQNYTKLKVIQGMQ
jgi:hypothetical protein